MKITTKITLDLQRPNFATEVEVMQDDGETRILEIAMASGGTAWDIPKGVSPVVVFRRPDGTKGMYDKLADGSSAVTTEGSTVTVVLSRQMLAIPGLVQASLQFEDAQLNQLTTFPFRVNVQANPYGGAQSVQDVVRLQWLETKLDECLKKAAESGEFDGKPGKTPVKGLDYFTREEIEQFQHTVYDRVHDEISPVIETATQAAGSAAKAGEAASASAKLADAAVAELQRRVEAGEFDGKTPVKGVDYWTEAEVQAAEDAVYQRVDGKLSPVVEQAKTAADQAVATANEAKKDAGTADKKVEALREVVSKFHNNIVETARGESIVLDDASDSGLEGLRVFGRTEQNGTPTPDSPVPLVSPGDDGNIAVSVTGKNLLDISSGINRGSGDGVTYVKNPDGSYKRTGTATGEVGNIWLVGGYKTIPPNNSETLFTLSPGASYIISDCVLFSVEKLGGDKYSPVGITGTFTIDPDRFPDGYVVNGVRNSKFNVGTTYNDTVYPMIRRASVSDPTFEPYSVSSITIPTPNGLPGIKVDSGGNYTDATGQQWICDEVDLERGVYVQRIEKFALSHTAVFQPDIKRAIYPMPLNPAKDIGMCNRYKSSAWNGTDPSFYASADGNVYIVDSEHMENDAVWKEYVTNNAIEVAYIIKNPVETPLSPELIAAYRALHTNYPNTNILNDEGAEMEVAYIADTKRYIDKKFDQLAKAMLR